MLRHGSYCYWNDIEMRQASCFWCTNQAIQLWHVLWRYGLISVKLETFMVAWMSLWMGIAVNLHIAAVVDRLPILIYLGTAGRIDVLQLCMSMSCCSWFIADPHPSPQSPSDDFTMELTTSILDACWGDVYGLCQWYWVHLGGRGALSACKGNLLEQVMLP